MPLKWNECTACSCKKLKTFTVIRSLVSCDMSLSLVQKMLWSQHVERDEHVDNLSIKKIRPKHYTGQKKKKYISLYKIWDVFWFQINASYFSTIFSCCSGLQYHLTSTTGSQTLMPVSSQQHCSIVFWNAYLPPTQSEKALWANLSWTYNLKTKFKKCLGKFLVSFCYFILMIIHGQSGL